ncbi:FKBP-type 22 kDa peptidyl-prolyl cis-trans isomerase [Mycobacterium simulans]|uniref:Peptidyl-prolyl cis-trans isomerase n=1 Tax=Mycobacterium simulans TaxID=627089 RepID=A0A7Z7NB63_9MYCO|nr:FKBP-type 22 kDa peptidyl-prolyl cis-trans isomerase [Mycobacterium simulans]
MFTESTAPSAQCATLAAIGDPSAPPHCEVPRRIALSPSEGLPVRHAISGCSVTAVKSSWVYSSVALAACVATIVLTPAVSGEATAAGSCPTAAPQNGGTPDWTLAGTTGSIAVTGSTDTTAPRVNVTAPFSVTQTQVQTLHAGDGPVVPGTARVSVCYMGVNGRDGSVFDSSYERGAPVDFPLGGVVPGFQKAIAGQKVGSTVAVAMTSADGYPSGQPSAGIRPGDTLVFAIKILGASS